MQQYCRTITHVTFYSITVHGKDCSFVDLAMAASAFSISSILYTRLLVAAAFVIFAIRTLAKPKVQAPPKNWVPMVHPLLIT